MNKSLPYETIVLPLKPNTQYLNSLAGKEIDSVVCGGRNTFCVVSGDKVQSLLGEKLFQECTSQDTIELFETNNEDEHLIESVNKRVDIGFIVTKLFLPKDQPC